MKLLNPQETKTQFNNKQAVDVVQAGYLKKVLADLQSSINTETTKFEQNLIDQRKVYTDEKLSLQGEIRALEGELRTKREERATLMIPVDTLKTQAEELVNELNNRKSNLVKQEEELEDKIGIINLKLDRLSQREQSATELEVSLMSRKVGIDLESQQISESHERVNKLMSDFNNRVQEKTKELAEKESALNIEKDRVKEYLDKREKEFADQTRGLADKRKALDRAFEELERLKLKK